MDARTYRTVQGTNGETDKRWLEMHQNIVQKILSTQKYPVETMQMEDMR